MIDLGLSLNTKNGRISQYAGLQFNSLAVMNGKLVGANSSGLFEFSSTNNSDNGTDIDAIVKTVSTDMGVNNQKKLRSIVLSGEFEGNLVVYPVFDDDDAEEHIIAEQNSYYQKTIKISTNADHRGTYLGVKIKNTDSSRFSIETIDILPSLLVMRNG